MHAAMLPTAPVLVALSLSRVHMPGLPETCMSDLSCHVVRVLCLKLQATVGMMQCQVV